MGAKLEPALLARIDGMVEESGLSKTAVIQSLLINGLGMMKGEIVVEKPNMEATAEKESTSDLENESPSDSSPNADQEEWWDGGHERGLEEGMIEGIKEGKLQLKGLQFKHADMPAFIPICPDKMCGKPNPNFPGLEKLAVCKNCKHPVGTPQEIKNDVVGGVKGGDCPWCGGKDAEMPA